MPSPFLKDDKPTKPEKPGKPDKPESAKDKPFSVPSIPLEFMPPAVNHPNRLVAVTDADGAVLYLAFSDGLYWRIVNFGESVPSPVPVEPEPDSPNLPSV